MSSSLLIDSKVSGFHVYCEIWEPYIGEELPCEIEEDIDRDPYAVSMMKRRQVVGHVPRYISRACALHLRSHGAITCTVTGGREYSSDLKQGGLQIPCTQCFTGDKNWLEKLAQLLKSSKQPEDADSSSPVRFMQTHWLAPTLRGIYI